MGNGTAVAGVVELVKCPKCGGTGLTQYRHVEGGRCFLCDGSGECTEEAAQAYTFGRVARAEAMGLEVVPAPAYKSKRITLPTLGEVEIRRFEDGTYALASESNVGTLISLFGISNHNGRKVVYLSAVCEGHLSAHDTATVRYVDEKRPGAYKALREELQKALKG